MEVSVVIPTYNRCAILRRALMLYDTEEHMRGRFEVVIVDDGSTDNTLAMLTALQKQLRFPLRYFSSARNAGPGAARNRAIKAATGTVILITGDDILPTAEMLVEHWRWHTEHYPAENVGVLGRVAWAEELCPTPFMRWLELKGTQFAYGLINHGDKVDYGHLYTSNVSMKRAFLERAAEFFDERLRLALGEDSEWGCRLFRKGFELRFNAGAIGKHVHPTTLASSLARMEALGRSAPALRDASPENFDRLTGRLFDPANRMKLRLVRALLHPMLGRCLYFPLSRLCERRFFAHHLFTSTHIAYFLKGLTDAGITTRTA